VPLIKYNDFPEPEPLNRRIFYKDFALLSFLLTMNDDALTGCPFGLSSTSKIKKKLTACRALERP